MIKIGYDGLLEDFLSTFCIMFFGLSILTLEIFGLVVLYEHHYNLWGLVAIIFLLSFNWAALHIYREWWG